MYTVLAISMNSHTSGKIPLLTGENRQSNLLDLGCVIHRLHVCKELVKLQMNVVGMMLNLNLGEATILDLWIILSKLFIFITLRSFQSHYGSIGCLNTHWTHVTTNNFTNNNVVLFLFRTWKYHTFTTIIPRPQCLGQERTHILLHCSIRDNNSKLS